MDRGVSREDQRNENGHEKQDEQKTKHKAGDMENDAQGCGWADRDNEDKSGRK